MANQKKLPLEEKFKLVGGIESISGDGISAFRTPAEFKSILNKCDDNGIPKSGFGKVKEVVYSCGEEKRFRISFEVYVKLGRPEKLIKETIYRYSPF